MKQFNLEEYLKNPTRKVITRDGRPVKILCTNYNTNQPIIAEIEGTNLSESFYKDGKWLFYEDSENDLFFALEKKEGWVKVYYGKSRCNTFVCNRIFATKEEAEKQKNDDVVAIIKIEWEE